MLKQGGKAAKRAGEPEDLPGPVASSLRVNRAGAQAKIRVKKTGCALQVTTLEGRFYFRGYV